jgi:dihydroorotate dehydrogenase
MSTPPFSPSRVALFALLGGSALSLISQHFRSRQPGYGYSSGLGLGSSYYYASNIVGKLIDPEVSHGLAVQFLSMNRESREFLGLTQGQKANDWEGLRTTLFGMEFANPLGLAAGFDKHGQCISGLADIGFGFGEIGSITPEPQEGNQRPRLFRLEKDQAIINRYGFNSHGVIKVKERLQERECGQTESEYEQKFVLGINVGKNASSQDQEASEKDFSFGIDQLGEFGDFLVINVSSPNTKGLRDLQEKKRLSSLIKRCKQAKQSAEQKKWQKKELAWKARVAMLQSQNQNADPAPDTPAPVKIPLLVKVSPDLDSDQVRDIAEVALSEGIDGLIVSNTTVERPDTLRSDKKLINETGGLSGAPLMERSTALLSQFYRLTNGKLPLIGVGGVFTGEDALKKIQAGASLVELYSSFAYRGPKVVTNIKSELAELLQKQGFQNVQQAVGTKLVDLPSQPGSQKPQEAEHRKS